MDHARTGKVPASFRVIAALGLLWNAMGAALYLWARLDPQAALAGADPAMRDYVAHQPLWANIGYGLGIWASLAGSAALALRSRHAPPLFLASFVGAALSHAGQFRAGVMPPDLAAWIMGGIAFLWWYSRRSAAAGLLR